MSKAKTVDKAWLDMRDMLEKFARDGRELPDTRLLFSQREKPQEWKTFYRDLEGVFNDIAAAALELSTRYNRKSFSIFSYMEGDVK